MKRICLYATQDQLNQLVKAATKAGMSVSRFVRLKVFSKDECNNYRHTGNGSKKRVEEIRAEQRVNKILASVNHF